MYLYSDYTKAFSWLFANNSNACSCRYIPLLVATFTFPQSLGILGGKPGVSTYIVAVQDDNAFYLDPHEVKQVVYSPTSFASLNS